MTNSAAILAPPSQQGSFLFDRRGQALVFLTALSLKFALLWLYPALYGGDTVLHLRDHDRILLGHQLPMLQILIYISYRITSAPIAFRIVMILIGSLAATGFYLLALRLTNRAAALWVGLFFVTNPFLNEISMVPFQEILMLGALCYAVYFYIDGRLGWAAVLLAVACWTRYEAWIICPILVYDYAARHGWKIRRVAIACSLFALAPALWIAAHHLSLSPPGTYVIEIPRTIGRLVRWVYIGWICAKNTPVPVLAFAAAGLFFCYRYRAERWRAALPFATVLGLFLIAILFSAHGTPHPGVPRPEFFVSAREATLPVGYILLLSACGLAGLVERRRARCWALSLAGLGVALGVLQSALFLHSETTQPKVQLCYRTARYLTDHVAPNEKVLIVAKQFSAREWDSYLKKAAQLQGARGAAGARGRLEQADLSPIDFQRTAIQTCLPETQLVAGGNPAGVRWIVVWSDSAPAPEVLNELRRFRKTRELQAGNLRVSVWKR